MSVLGRQDGWYKVNYDGKTGYMSADYVTARSSAGDLRCVARVISDGLNLRSGAAASGAVLATVSRGEYVDVSGFENGWFRVQYSGKTGYMSGDHLTLAAARPAAPAPAPAAPASGTGAEIAALAADLSTGLARLQDAFAEVQVIFDDAQNAFDDMQLPETGAEETEEEA